MVQNRVISDPENAAAILGERERECKCWISMRKWNRAVNRIAYPCIFAISQRAALFGNNRVRRKLFSNCQKLQLVYFEIRPCYRSSVVFPLLTFPNFKIASNDRARFFRQ